MYITEISKINNPLSSRRVYFGLTGKACWGHPVFNLGSHLLHAKFPRGWPIPEDAETFPFREMFLPWWKRCNHVGITSGTEGVPLGDHPGDGLICTATFASGGAVRGRQLRKKKKEWRIPFGASHLKSAFCRRNLIVKREKERDTTDDSWQPNKKVGNAGESIKRDSFSFLMAVVLLKRRLFTASSRCRVSPFLWCTTGGGGSPRQSSAPRRKN